MARRLPAQAQMPPTFNNHWRVAGWVDEHPDAGRHCRVTGWTTVEGRDAVKVAFMDGAQPETAVFSPHMLLPVLPGR